MQTITKRYSVFMIIVIQGGISFASVCPDIGLIQNADVTYSRDPPHKPGTVANIKCDKGYKGHGNPNLVCLNDGSWSAPPPFCSAGKCKRDKNKLEKGRDCQKKCKSDEDCKGQFKRCQCDDWCGKSCFNPFGNCEKLSPPKNGYMNGTILTYGYTVTYGCNDGFTLLGSKSRKCRSDNKWSGTEPKCLPLGSCGQSGVDDERVFSGNVIDGDNAKNGAWPWQVLLFFNTNYYVGQFYDRNQGFGGGTVIDQKWILTAAHLFDDILTLRRNVDWKKEFLLVAGMTIYPDPPHEEIPEYVNVFEPHNVYRHNLYDNGTFDYDVALIRVGKRLKRDGMKFIVDEDAPEGIIEFSWHIRPICLPCVKVDPESAMLDISKSFDKFECGGLSDFAEKNSEAIVTGFGWVYHHIQGEVQKYRPKTLQQGLVKVARDNNCVKTVQLRSIQARYTDRMFCAVSANESLVTDARKGDSGGPVIKQVSRSGIKFWLQIGIVSWGFNVDDKDPGFYTSVPSVMTWIWEIIEKYSPTTEVTCRELQIEPHSKFLNYKSTWKFGDTAEITCQPGYISADDTSTTKIVCLSTGEWSRDPPKCVDLSVCGQSGQPIVSPGFAAEGSWPWHAVLFFNRSASPDIRMHYFALGSIINEKFILTAGHLSNGRYLGPFFIAVGLTTMPEAEGELPDHAMIYSTGGTFVRNSYYDFEHDFDAMLVRVGVRMKTDESKKLVWDPTGIDGVIQFSRHIRPVCLPCMKTSLVDGEKVYDETCNTSLLAKPGNTLILAGYNPKFIVLFEKERFLKLTLQYQQVTIQDDETCEEPVKEVREYWPTARYTQRMFCAKNTNETVTTKDCIEISGAPLTTQISEPNGDKRSVQVGIVSWGPECGGQAVGYHTSVPVMMRWIWNVISHPDHADNA